MDGATAQDWRLDWLGQEASQARQGKAAGMGPTLVNSQR